MRRYQLYTPRCQVEKSKHLCGEHTLFRREIGTPERVATIIDTEAKKSPMKWNHVNYIIISAIIYCRFVKTTYMQMHSPTKDAVGEEDQFYEQLQKEIDATPIYNEDLCHRTCMSPISEEIKVR